MTTDRGPAVDRSIVIPAHNEQERLPSTIAAIRDYAVRTAVRWELVVVDDGSVDQTAQVVERIDHGPLEVCVLRNERNCGKGASVRRGMLQASGSLRLMCDADLSTSIEEFDAFCGLIDQGYDVVVASRDLPGSVVDPPQPWHRRCLALAFRGLRRRMMLPELYDTQCGFKLFTAGAAQQIFALQVEDGFAFDVEVLGLAHHLGLRVKEVPVRWANDPDSRVRPLRDGFNMVRRLVAIRRRMRRLSNGELE